ncbi:MAG: hypothetical protein E7360_06290 [Clostridiales bacterium]|nr:hypothetical protein [Clostridiales bacterium]
MEKKREVLLNQNTTEKVLKYVRENWVKSIRPANDVVPYPFTSPSITGFYKAFFYWDNYFIHKGLMLDGVEYQVKHNLDNFKYYIERFGYMPNSNVFLNRSQPPLFTKCVYEYYLFKGDKSILEEYLPAILREYKFWMTERILPCGLNSYGCTATDHQLKFVYEDLSARVEETRDTEQERIKLARDILAVAESGLDFNMRFITEESKIDASKFIHLDINCFLYDVERTVSTICNLLGRKDEEKAFLDYANKRKELMDRYLLDKEQGIYLDYNFVDGSFSKILSAVSFYPYVYGISNDVNGAKKILERLELPFGISPCEFRGEDSLYFQWDYPCVWPYTSWFAYTGLKRVGLNEDAERIAKKYMEDVNLNFERTGVIWEKYDGRDGSVAVTNEYETPEMLGWSAGVYRVFADEMGLCK